MAGAAPRAGLPGGTPAVAPLVQAWRRVQGRWLAVRLRRVERELLELEARLADESLEMPSKHDLADYDHCCMERAVLRARLARCLAGRGTTGSAAGAAVTAPTRRS